MLTLATAATSGWTALVAGADRDIKSVFETGIEKLISGLSSGLFADEEKEARAKAVSLLARAVGAIVLSRACPDDALLADEILYSCKLSLAI